MKEESTKTEAITKVSIEDVNDDDMDAEEVNPDEWDDDFENPIGNNDCIFCAHHSDDFVENVRHMSVVHSFFIPDTEYIVDLEGLLMYLGEKVARGKYQFSMTFFQSSYNDVDGYRFVLYLFFRFHLFVVQ